MRRLKAFFAGWHGLGRFWAGVILATVAGALTLQGLGPPGAERHRPVADAVEQPVPAPPAPGTKTMTLANPLPLPVERPGRDTPGPVTDPDPALLEPYPGSDTDSLPRIAADGRKAMKLYAAGFDLSNRHPRVGIMVAGFGQMPADTRKAISGLPGGVSFAVSPYTRNLEALLAGARLAGHEYLLSVPMEPQGFPTNDPGARALMTNLSPAQNLPRLRWVLSRVNGYVGATAVLGALRGDRFIDLPDQLGPVLAELDQRGLLYVDPRIGQGPLPGAWNRNIDIVIDEPATGTNIDANLAALEAWARDHGTALGLATLPRPVTIERIAAWTNGLANRGFILTPVSALMLPPATNQEVAR